MNIIFFGWILMLSGLASSALLKRTTCVCGKENGNRRGQKRIVNGFQVENRRFPWSAHITLHLNETYAEYCGGALISDRHILTAAHCLIGVPSVTVTLGTDDTHVGGKKVLSSDLAFHKKFNFTNGNNDIGIITLPISIRFTRKISPICIPDSNMDLTNLTVAGWGVTTANATTISRYLNAVSVFHSPFEDCAKTWKKKVNSTIKICAGNSDKGVCHGDSGGPLMSRVGKAMYAVGVTSMSLPNCAFDDHQAIFTRVIAYKEFINKHTTNGETCSEPQHT